MNDAIWICGGCGTGFCTKEEMEHHHCLAKAARNADKKKDEDKKRRGEERMKVKLLAHTHHNLSMW